MEFAENHLNFFPYSFVLYELVGWTVGWFVGIRMFLLICSYLYRLRQWSKFKWQGGPDQWAVVVGATGALGRQYAKKLLDKDYNLLLISNNDAKLEDIKMILMKMKHNKLIKTHVMDLRKDDDSMYDSLEIVLNDLGGNVDVWVNAFSVKYPNNRPNYISMIHDEDIEDMIAVNVVAFTRLMEMALSRMVPKKRGVVINMSSFSAIYPTPLLGLFSASKAYVDYLSRAVSEEYCCDGVFIQSVLPYNVTNDNKRRYYESTPEFFVRKAMNTVGLYKRTTATFGLGVFRAWNWEINNWNKVFLKEVNVANNHYHVKKLMKKAYPDLEALIGS